MSCPEPYSTHEQSPKLRIQFRSQVVRMLGNNDEVAVRSSEFARYSRLRGYEGLNVFEDAVQL